MEGYFLFQNNGGELYHYQDLHFVGGGPFSLYRRLAISLVIFAPDMTTFYCHSLEEALKRAKIAGKRLGCRYCGIALMSRNKVLRFMISILFRIFVTNSIPHYE